MEMRADRIYILFALIILSSCKKAEDRSCLKITGEETTKIVSLETVDSLFLYNNIIYTIIPDTSNYVELIGGKNLLNHIECLNFDQKLEVRNKNKCNFLRSFKNKLNANIHVKKIKYIHFEGTENLSNSDTLKSGELRLVIRDGAGPVDLTVKNSYMSAVVTHGWGDFTIRGSTLSAFLNCSTNSFCNTTQLRVESDLKVYSNTGGNMTVNSHGAILEAIIKRDGHIFYQGTPNSIQLDKSGSGELIQL